MSDIYKIDYRESVYDLSDFSIVDEPTLDSLSVSENVGYEIVDKKAVTGMGLSILTVPTSTDVGSDEMSINYALVGELDSLEVLSYFSGYNSLSAVADYDNRLHFYGSDGYLYELRVNTSASALLPIYKDYLHFDSKPIALNYRDGDTDCIIFAGDDNSMTVWSPSYSTPRTLALSNKLTSLCTSEDVLYATIAGDAKKIWYTTSLLADELEGEGSGTVTLSDERGDCIKVVAYKGYVYAFREYGITRISQLASGALSISQLHYSPSRIYENTICVCGDEMFFLTREGLFSFDGINVDKIDITENDMLEGVDNQNAIACCVGDNYYLSARTDSASETAENVLIAVNIYEHTTHKITDCDVCSMVALKDTNVEKMVCSLGSGDEYNAYQIDSTGQYLDDITTKTIITNEIQIAEDSPAIIKALQINCSAGTTIDINTDRGTLHFCATKDGYNVFAVYAKARFVKLNIQGNDATAYVERVSLKITEI